jgi:hypothetical protein
VQDGNPYCLQLEDRKDGVSGPRKSLQSYTSTSIEEIIALAPFIAVIQRPKSNQKRKRKTEPDYSTS